MQTQTPKNSNLFPTDKFFHMPFFLLKVKVA